MDSDLPIPEWDAEDVEQILQIEITTDGVMSVITNMSEEQVANAVTDWMAWGQEVH